MRVLVACEFSGRVRDAFLSRGHDAWSCDLEPTETPGPHLQVDVLGVLAQGWDLMIAHPPCTYLTNAGVRFFQPHAKGKCVGQARFLALEHAAAFFNALQSAPIPKICIENPIPNRWARAKIGPYSQIIHPWQFGHHETKPTALWLKGLPWLQPTDIKIWTYQPQSYLPQSKDRAKLRSYTYRGIAQAMAQQWG